MYLKVVGAFIITGAAFNINDNEKYFLSSIRMIFEGKRDTEDWSNGAENSALHHRNKMYQHWSQLF